MRDILVTVVFIAGALMALRRPYYGALLWVWIGLMNPHRLGWGFAYSLPFALLAVIATLAGMLFNHKAIRWPGGGPLVALMMFMVWTGLTTLTAILVEPSFERYWVLIKIIFMTFVVAMLIRTREQIIGLVWVIAGSVGFFGIKGGIFTILTGGGSRVWGPPDSVVEGNNEIAVAIIVIVPMLYFLARDVRLTFGSSVLRVMGERWAKLGLYFAMALCMVAALGSQSRGALLAAVAMTAVLWWRSEGKLQLAVALLVAVPAILLFLPETWYSRMDTIGSYEQDNSAMGRINAWTMAFNIAKDRIMGAGFATAAPIIYERYAPDPTVVLVAHSIYFQVLGEHGFVGLIIYLLLWIMTYRTAGRIVRLAKDLPGLQWAMTLASMTKVSIVGFAVGGAFLSLAYWDLPYYLIAVLVVLERLVKDTIQQASIQSARESSDLNRER